MPAGSAIAVAWRTSSAVHSRASSCRPVAIPARTSTSSSHVRQVSSTSSSIGAAGRGHLADAALGVLLLVDRRHGAGARAGERARLEPVVELGGLRGHALGLGGLAAVVVQERLRPERLVEDGLHALQARALLGDLDVGHRLVEAEPLLLEARAGDREPAEDAVLAGGAGHGERAVERGVAVVEALGEQRGAGDVDGALEARAERGVVDPGEPVDRAVEQRRGRVGVARALRAERADRLRAGAQRVLAAGVGRGAGAPVAHRGRVAGVEAGGGHLQRERRAALLRRVLERGQQAPARVAVAAEQVLDPRGLGDDAEPLGRALGRQQREHVEQRLAALVQAAGVGQRLGHRAEQLRAARPVGVGEQPRAGAVPAGGGGGRGGGGRGGGLLEQRDGRAVARPRALLHVEGAHGRARAAGGQGGRHPLVGREPPRRGSGVVDGTAQERMAEPERAPVARGADADPRPRGGRAGRARPRGPARRPRPPARGRTGRRPRPRRRAAPARRAGARRPRGGRRRGAWGAGRRPGRGRPGRAPGGRAGCPRPRGRAARAARRRRRGRSARATRRGGAGRGGGGRRRRWPGWRGGSGGRDPWGAARRRSGGGRAGGGAGGAGRARSRRRRPSAGRRGGARPASRARASRAGSAARGGSGSARRRRRRRDGRPSRSRRRGGPRRGRCRRTRSGGGAGWRRGRRGRRSRGRRARRARARPRGRRARAGRPPRPATARRRAARSCRCRSRRARRGRGCRHP